MLSVLQTVSQKIQADISMDLDPLSLSVIQH